MARVKKSGEEGKKEAVDYRHKNVKRLNIPPAGLTAPMVPRERMKVSTSSLALQIEGNV
jgi:hypothetical protein